MMGEECPDITNVEIEDLQQFLSKISNVKRTVKKLYDKKVLAMVHQQKKQN